MLNMFRMQRFYVTHILVILSTAFTGAISSAEDIRPSSQISSVLLHNDGAIVQRTSTITLPESQVWVEWQSLPTNLLPEQIQLLTGESNTSLVVREVQFSQEKESEEEFSELKTQIEEVKKQIAQLHVEKQNALAQYDFARAVTESFSKSFGEHIAQDERAIAKAQSLASYLQEAKQTLDTAGQEITSKTTALQEQLKELQKTLAEEQQKRAQLRGIVRVRLEGKPQLEETVILSYINRQASWKPVYEFRADVKKQNVQLQMQADISQQTGEDWQDVSLTIFANSILQQSNPPKLYPIRLEQENNYRKVAPMRALSQATSKSEAFLSEDSFGEATIEQTTTSFSAKIPGVVTVTSGEAGTSVPVISARMTAEFWSTIVPKFSNNAYLTAKGKNPFTFPIIPGRAFLFVDQNLVGNTYMEKTLPAAEMELSLGVDQKLKVERKESENFTENTGLIDKTKTVTRTYKNTVQSFHPEKHLVKIYDQFPLSGNGKIAVNTLEPKTKDITLEEDTGIFHWSKTFAPEESETFTTSFEIVYPREWEITPQL